PRRTKSASSTGTPRWTRRRVLIARDRESPRSYHLSPMGRGWGRRGPHNQWPRGTCARLGAGFSRLPYNQLLMKSKLAKESRKALLEANQRLTPEQRVQASVEQSRVIAQLQEAGRRLRERSR